MKIKNAKLETVCYCLYALMASTAILFVPGCENTNNKITLSEKIEKLTQEKMQLTHEAEQCRTDSEQFKKQLEVLAGLEPGAKLENLYRLRKISITRYTNLYDKDKDGKAESLIVYIQPIDEQGDIIKATGAVDVQLWDLNKKAGSALLGQWHVKPVELKKLWFATLITINYRLTFDVADKIEKFQKPLTVKVTFTDYLTGRVFTEQKVIKPLS